MTSLILIGALCAGLTMFICWRIAVRTDNYSYVDLGWAANFLVLACVYGQLGTGEPLRKWLIGGMYVVWSARLTWHLARRIVGRAEEGRYVELRRKWSAHGNVPLKFLGFFAAQAVLNLLLAVPLLLAVINPDAQLHRLETFAAVLWAVALLGESVADSQLSRFKRDPANAGQVCDVGLWSVTRHPNYFFEWLIWVAYAAFALASPYGWVALAMPALMLHLLLNVTGVKPTEEQAVRSKGDAYRRYQATVSAFIPWVPSRSEGGWGMHSMERGWLPDALIRFGIRRLLKQRLREETKANPELQQRHMMQLVQQLRVSPLAIHTAAANEQHYELPAPFFEAVLGKHLKYSCCYYRDASSTLDEAEMLMLEMTVERARLLDGDRILELGCGWGSLTLHMAKCFPNSHITAVSNSHSQRKFIEARAHERGLFNIEVITCDVNVLAFAPNRAFDRVVSVEMFEHVRNYEVLFERVASWLKPGGTLFVHIFTHRHFAYPFEVRDASDWMAKYFFTGGIMPSDDLLLYFQNTLKIREHWQVDGRHYQRTAEDWLLNMDRTRERVLPMLAATYGEQNVQRWWTYWRVFFMACAELWGYEQGREWHVSHYLFQKPRGLLEVKSLGTRESPRQSTAPSPALLRPA